MERNPCPHDWRQQTVEIRGRSSPVARWVCTRCHDATDADPHAPGDPPWRRRAAATFGGSGSWSLRSDDATVLDAVVYLRDACALPRGSSALDPPPLRQTPAPWSWSVDDATRERAGRQWSFWWREIVGVEHAPHDAATLHARAPGPELNAAVRDLWPVACSATRRRDPGTHRPPVDRDVLAQVVDDVGFDRDVAPGALHGRLVVLDVSGPWWALASPGSVLASPAALADPGSVQLLLRAVFESGLS